MNDTSSTTATPDLVSIVVPAYNETDGIAEFNRRLAVSRVFRHLANLTESQKPNMVYLRGHQGCGEPVAG
jgi:hypothetical protein